LDQFWEVFSNFETYIPMLMVNYFWNILVIFFQKISGHTAERPPAITRNAEASKWIFCDWKNILLCAWEKMKELLTPSAEIYINFLFVHIKFT
jgi:hypothetical protein